MKQINLNDWTRKDTFLFFKDFEKPYYSITAKVDVTKSFEYFEKYNLSKYNGFLWFITSAANRVDELKTRIRDNNSVVLHDRVDPSFTVLTDQKTIAFCTVQYTPDTTIFFDGVEKGTQQIKENPNLEDEPGKDNLLFVSCLPWVDFTSISHPMDKDKTDSIPRISWGKFSHSGLQIRMPVNIQVHHALADGYHLGLFFKHLEELMKKPDAIDWPSV